MLFRSERQIIYKLTAIMSEINKSYKKPKVSRRKEIIKIRAEINEIETKKKITKINETKRDRKSVV